MCDSREYKIWNFGQNLKEELDEFGWDSFVVTYKTEMQRICVT
jgi:hypothetical protein